MANDEKEKFKKDLEAKIKEQNLIHELVIINELLLIKKNELRKQTGQMPKLEREVLNLQKMSQALQKNQCKIEEQQVRIEQARQEAKAYRQQRKEIPFTQHWDTAYSPAEDKAHQKGKVILSSLSKKRPFH